MLGSEIALVVFAVTVGDIPEARPAGVVDFGLVVVVALACVLSRGWQAWRPGTTGAADVARLLGGAGASMGRDSFACRAAAGAVAAFGTAALGDEDVLAAR